MAPGRGGFSGGGGSRGGSSFGGSRPSGGGGMSRPSGGSSISRPSSPSRPSMGSSSSRPSMGGSNISRPSSSPSRPSMGGSNIRPSSPNRPMTPVRPSSPTRPAPRPIGPHSGARLGMGGHRPRPMHRGFGFGYRRHRGYYHIHGYRGTYYASSFGGVLMTLGALTTLIGVFIALSEELAVTTNTWFWAGIGIMALGLVVSIFTGMRMSKLRQGQEPIEEMYDTPQTASTTTTTTKTSSAPKSGKCPNCGANITGKCPFCGFSY